MLTFDMFYLRLESVDCLRRIPLREPLAPLLALALTRVIPTTQ